MQRKACRRPWADGSGQRIPLEALGESSILPPLLSARLDFTQGRQSAGEFQDITLRGTIPPSLPNVAPGQIHVMRRVSEFSSSGTRPYFIKSDRRMRRPLIPAPGITCARFASLRETLAECRVQPTGGLQ